MPGPFRLTNMHKRCDNNNETALDLAVMWSMLTDNAFPAPVQTAYLWPIWWHALSNFRNLMVTTASVGSNTNEAGRREAAPPIRHENATVKIPTPW